MFCVRVRHLSEWQPVIVGAVLSFRHGALGHSLYNDNVLLQTRPVCSRARCVCTQLTLPVCDVPPVCARARQSCSPVRQRISGANLLLLLRLLFQPRWRHYRRRLFHLLSARSRSRSPVLSVTVSSCCHQLVEAAASSCLVQLSWCRRLLQLVAERVQLLEATWWLSTLGGAFSALGDADSRCAAVAGRISSGQLQLASRLGAIDLQLRCYLYLALSHVQRGGLHAATRLLRVFRRRRRGLLRCCDDRRLDNIYAATRNKLRRTRDLCGRNKVC